MKKLFISVFVIVVLLMGFGVAFAQEENLEGASLDFFCPPTDPWCNPNWSGDKYALVLDNGHSQDCNSIGCEDIKIAALVQQWAYVALKNRDIYWKIFKPGTYDAKVITGCYVTNGKLKLDFDGFDDLTKVLPTAEPSVKIPVWFKYQYDGWLPTLWLSPSAFNAADPVMWATPVAQYFYIYMKLTIADNQKPGLYRDPGYAKICFTYVDHYEPPVNPF